jgi:hypothetical protein
MSYGDLNGWNVVRGIDHSDECDGLIIERCKTASYKADTGRRR